MSDWARTHARVTDPDTSHAAAAKVDRQSMLAALEDAFIRDHNMGGMGLIAEQAARNAGFTPADGAWKRVSDLKRMNVVEDTGRRLRASTGRVQAVLRWVPKAQREGRLL